MKRKWFLLTLIVALGIAQLAWRVLENPASGAVWCIGALWGAAFALAVLLVAGKLKTWGKE